MPLGGEGEVGTVQEFGADPGAAGGHLLHSGGSTVKRRLLAPVWVGGPFMCTSPWNLAPSSGSLLMGGRVNPWSGRNNPQCSPGPASPPAQSPPSASRCPRTESGHLASPPACTSHGLVLAPRHPTGRWLAAWGERGVSSPPACIKNVPTLPLTSHVTGTALGPGSSAL